MRAVNAAGEEGEWSDRKDATPSDEQSSTATPTATPASNATATPTPTATPASNATATPTPTATPAPNATATPTATPTPTAAASTQTTATPTLTPNITGKLPAPSLTAEAKGANAVELNWTAVAGAARYNLALYTVADGHLRLDDVIPPTTTFTHPALTASRTYYYWVRAVNAAGEEGDWSVRMDATPSDEQSSTATPTATPASNATTTPTATATPASNATATPTATFSALSKPVLTAEAKGANAVELNWTAVAGAAHYRLWAWSATASYQLLDDVVAPATTFTHTGLSAGTTYDYWVRAVSAAGEEGALSDPKDATVGAAQSSTATPTSVAPAPAAERAALVAFYNATSGANWTHNDNWLNIEPISTWYGVFIDETGHVSELVLNDNGLNGSLPDLSALTNLTKLSFGYNQLSGPIPDLSKLTKLRRLDFNSNELNGQIPNLSALTKLNSLNLTHNQLDGQIPNLSSLTNLRWLGLDYNQLDGRIPEVSALTNLRTLSLSNNQLEGHIPDLSALTNLQYLGLDHNEFNGQIPELSALTQLTGLYLNNNDLSGPIPKLSTLTSLTGLNLSNNAFNGPIPELSTLTNLTWLSLNNNDLSGQIPELSTLTSLTSLNLSNNDLSGPVLDLNLLTSLGVLNLSNNDLSGPVPDLSALSSLGSLNLSGNRLCLPAGASLSHPNSYVNAQLTLLNPATCTEAELTTTPGVPQNFSATVGVGQVTLTWDAVTNAASYGLRAWDSIDRRWIAIADAVTDTTTYTQTVQTDGRNYHFQVRARDANNLRGPWSARLYVVVVSQQFPPPPLSLGLDPFYYQKYFEVGGLFVVAPSEVSDAKMVQARSIITGMLSTRPDLLQTMTDNGTGIYFHGYPGPRGISNKSLGAWNTHLSAEDRHCGTFIHEIAHLIHFALEEQADGETFNSRLHAAYQSALNAGLWEGHYASSDSSEYWAEMVQFWFQKSLPPPLTGNYPTLADYDAEAAKLVEEVFGDSATVPAACKP